MGYVLDTTDIKLLGLLQEDAKITAKRLGKELNLTQTPVFERIKKLEREGYIRGYTAVLNERKLGLKQTVFIGVTLKGHTRSYLDKFMAKMNDFPEVLECYQVTGSYDFMLKLVLKDIEAYQTFVETKLSLLPDLGNVHTYIAIKRAKQTKNLDLSALERDM